MITAIIFDAFGTLFKAEKGASVKTIIYNMISSGYDDKEHIFIVTATVDQPFS